MERRWDQWVFVDMGAHQWSGPKARDGGETRVERTEWKVTRVMVMRCRVVSPSTASSRVDPPIKVGD